MKLFYRESGQGPSLIILHGLFGSSDNWYGLSKEFSAHFRVFVPDQRNHGLSPHSADMNYPLMVEDLKEFIDTHHIQAPVIMGHSMGGKVAMNFAMKYPDSLSRLIVVDIAPKAYPVHHEAILKGLKAIDPDGLTSRQQADDMLRKYVPDPAVRQFLLKNLARNERQEFIWRPHIAALDTHIEEMGEDLNYSGQFSKPTLFIKGSRSDYILEEDKERILRLFPGAVLTTLPAGHWVQAESPREFVQAVYHFLTR